MKNKDYLNNKKFKKGMKTYFCKLVLFLLVSLLFINFGSAVECADSPVNGCTINSQESNWNNTIIDFPSNLIINYNLNIFNNSNVNLSASRTWTVNDVSFIINQSIFNISAAAQITGNSTRKGSLYIKNSTVYGNSGTSFNRINIPSNSSNLTIESSEFIGLRYILFDSGVSNNPISIINSTFNNFVTSFLEITSSTNTLLYNFTGYNLITAGGSGAIKISTSNNTLIDKINITNTSHSSTSGIYISGGYNHSIKNSYLKDISGVCVASRDNSNNTVWINNTLINCGAYGIDNLEGARNILVENNTITNASNGIAFSFSTESSNFISKNNQIFNDRTYGLTFNTANNGSSYNDYIVNSSGRCLSITDNSRNIYIQNVSCLDNQIDGIVVGSSRNITLNNITVNNSGNYDFYFADSDNITINNIYLPTNIYHIRLDNVTNLNIYNHNFYNALINNTDISLYSYLNFYNVENLLIYNTTGYLCNGSSSNINSNDNNVNLTLKPSEDCFVLDNFNLTEGSSRTNSPLGLTESTQGEVHITSTLADGVDLDGVLIILNEDCDLLDYLVYISDSGATNYRPNYTCENDLLVVSIDGVEGNSVNSNILYIFQQKAGGMCNGFSSGIGSFATKIGIILSILALVVILGYLMTLYLASQKYSTASVPSFNMTHVSIVVGGLGLIIVSMIIFLVIISTVCSLL